MIFAHNLVLSYSEDTRQYDAQLQNLGMHVVDLPSSDLSLILQEILTVGRLTLATQTANNLVRQLQTQINDVKAKVAGTTAPKVLIESDYSTLSANPQYIILTEDPTYGGDVNAVYKRSNWGSIEALKLHKVYRINSNIIGRPGPRLVLGLQCLAQIIHPEKYAGALPACCTGTA